MMENIPEELLSAEHGGFVNFGITEVSNSEGSAEADPFPEHCLNSSWKSLGITNCLWPNYT